MSPSRGSAEIVVVLREKLARPRRFERPTFAFEGLLPRQPKAGTPADQVAASIEEQRRLFFVAITRVKALPALGKPGTLILTYSRQMPSKICKAGGIDPASTMWGVATLQGSRFLAQLGPYAPAPVAG
jgi:ATP-dependent DNA helicase UvrD/PcrA